METRTQYKCNVCGQFFTWSKEAISFMEFFAPRGRPLAGWEDYFIICSTKCRQNPNIRNKHTEFCLANGVTPVLATKKTNQFILALASSKRPITPQELREIVTRHHL